MTTPPLTREQCQVGVAAVEQALAKGFKIDGLPSAWKEAARALGMSSGAVFNRVEKGREKFGLVVRQSVSSVVETRESEDFDLRGVLNRGPQTLAQIIAATGAEVGAILDRVEALIASGVNVHRNGERFEIVKDAQPSFKAREPLRYFSRPDNTFVFGATGDQHMGSKYSRYDVVEDLYDRFVEAGVDRVFNTGNWIDGDARFNKFDLEAHGLDAQCQLLAERYPRREGIGTYAIWGDDHEGWYAQREGVDVGVYARNVMAQAGRDDWFDIGFMESHIELVNSNTGATAVMAVVHPGGGSAYALSYSIQKIVESYEGGEKPNVALYGHYHKLWSGLIRNVWVLQTGTTQDQTVFMRKKRLEAHVGGAIVKMKQDPESGAILSFSPELIRYFNKEWYTQEGRANGRWSYTRAAKPIPRSVGAIR